MKIDRTGPVRPSAPTKRSDKAGKARGGDFAQHLKAEPETVAGAASTAPVASVDALLAIQEVGDSTSGQPKSRARKWGNDVLDQLEQLRIGIISGVIPRHELERVALMVERQRVRTDDPVLESILDEIELRAKVELAKLERPR